MPLARLQEIGARHQLAMVLTETMALGALVADPQIDPDELQAFIKFRASASLRASFGTDSAGFEAALLELPALQAELGL